MKARKGIRAAAGVLLCLLGILLEVSMPGETVHTFRVDAGGCRLVTDIVEPWGGPAPRGYVVLLHGLAGSKRVMSYMTEAFASQGLRVFVPDLPGHGRTDEPFSFNRAEQCSDNLLRELIARGLLDPERTVLAGHSMGGAIALRVATHQPVAGVIAVSPAPMHTIEGLPPETIPYHDFGKLPAHSLVLTGENEPTILTRPAAELVSSSGDTTSKYLMIPHVSHVSILFSSKAAAEEQKWSDGVLKIEPRVHLPAQRGVLGLVAGLVGIVVLAGPFLRELMQFKRPRPGKEPAPQQEARVPTGGSRMTRVRMFLEFGGASLVAVATLRFWNPARFLRFFEGDYFAGLLLLVGLVVLAMHAGSLRRLFVEADFPSARAPYLSALLAAFAATLLYVLFSAWFELSFTETWPTAARAARLLPMVLLFLPCHLAEETLLGPTVKPSQEFRRLLTTLLIRLLVWLVLLAAIFQLHSAQLIPVLLAPFFALFCLGQRWAMDVVREVTGTPLAAAIFGAILLSGFCLVVFPTT